MAASIVNHSIDEKVSFGDALIQISDGCILVTQFEIMSPTLALRDRSHQDVVRT